MTLVVSARVPDGVVIGADSLATLSVQGKGTALTSAKCPECGHEHDVQIEVELPQGLGTLSTLPYSLKLLPLHGRLAIGHHGSAMIGSRTIFSLLLEYERENKPASLRDTAQGLAEWLHGQLAETMNVNDIPEGKSALGFQAVGYENGEPKTFVGRVGRKPAIDEKLEFGVTVSGETALVTKLWELPRQHSQMSSAYNAWSVLDAADYIKFLISTTANFQRFVTMVPTVGGDIDIGLITPHGNFSWITKKPLVDLLLPEQKGGETNGD
ncbi:MAG: hypothetical protein IH933_03720 [Euryarchaeota archaeon]|nr:hypothetical protein [Euryarchaeota archaeon]